MSLRFLRLLIMLIKVCFVGHFLGCLQYGLFAGKHDRLGEPTWFDTYAETCM